MFLVHPTDDGWQVRAVPDDTPPVRRPDYLYRTEQEARDAAFCFDALDSGNGDDLSIVQAVAVTTWAE